MSMEKALEILEAPVDVFPLDDATPTDRAYLIDQRDSLLHAHGGVVTEVKFDAVEVIPLEQFLREDLEQLKDRSSLTVVRDSLSSRSYMLYGDQAIRYTGCRFNDVGVDELGEHLEHEKKIELFPNINHPLVGFTSYPSRGVKKITVLLESFSFLFKWPSVKLEERIYLPPTWFGLVMTSAGLPRDVYLAVVDEATPDCKDAKLKTLPLPNIGSSGRVCQGQVRQLLDIGQGATDGVVVNSMISRVFDSNWNLDLMTDNYDAILGGPEHPVYEVLEQTAPAVKERFDSFIDGNKMNTRVCNQLRVLAVLSLPKGWMSLVFQPLSLLAKEFLAMAEG